MIKIRKADEIYHKDMGWVDSWWHFSFDEYYDPNNMGFGTMRVFNDDWLGAGQVWPMHPHRNVEALTYVASGFFRHADNLDTGGEFPAGSIQRMTLGRGAYHSEQNASETEPVRFIQIWIMPREQGLEPSVEQKQFGVDDRLNKLFRAISPAGSDGSAMVHQDASMYISRLEDGNSVSHEFESGSGGYLYVIDGGPTTVNGQTLNKGDAAMITDENKIEIAAQGTAELIMVEVRV